jgi:hypothetical protein
MAAPLAPQLVIETIAKPRIVLDAIDDKALSRLDEVALVESELRSDTPGEIR